MLLCVFIDRVNLAMAAPLILAEFKLSPSLLGLLMSGFIIAVMVRGTSILKSGYFSALPWFAGLLGLLVLGPLSDKIGKKYRGNWMAACQFLSVPFTAYAVITPLITISLICFSISLFFIVGSMAVSSALIWDLFDRVDVAKAYGMLAAWMTAAGIVAPYLLGFILEKTNSFNTAYYIFSGSAVLAGFIALILHVRERHLRVCSVQVETFG